MKKILLIVLGIFMVINLTGCYDYREIQRYAVVTGIAIDKGKEEGKYAVTCEVATFEVGKEGKLKPVLIEQEADSVIEALRKMIASVAKKMYGGHCKVLILSEEIAKEGVFDVLDYFLRAFEVRSTISIFMAKGSSAKDMLKETAVYSDIAGYEIERMGFNDTQYLGYGREIFLYQAMNTMLSEGVELTLPILELEEGDKGKTFHLKGVALFKDEKLIGTLEPEEVRFYLSFLNEFSSGVATIELENGVLVSYQLLNGKTKTKVECKKDNFKFDVKFKVNFYVDSISHDKNDQPYNLTMQEAEQILTKYWKDKMTEVFSKIQEMNTDVVNYGRLIMGKDFKLWKSIQDKEGILQKAEVKINVETNYLGEGRGK